MKILIRKIKQEDNEAIKNIIRTTLEEFDGAKPGTAYDDYDTMHMFVG